MNYFKLLLLFLLLAICGLTACSRSKYVAEVTDSSVQSPGDTDEIYYSNYFSFHGQDEHGRVLFAMDNNRWKRGDKFGAEHFLAMYADSGWIELKGKDKYKNADKKLVSIPSSKWFSFSGSPEDGLSITSKSNDLKLIIEPLVPRDSLKKGYANFATASAKATLDWKERKIKGRVIQEKLRVPRFSKRLKQFLTLGGGSFTGLYLNVEGKGELYLHKNAKKEGGLSFITGFEEGFLTFPSNQEWDDFETEILKTDKSLFFSFPLHMKFAFSVNGASAVLEINTVDLKKFSNLVFFGFAMGYVEGSLTVGDKTYPVYGFSELIAT